MSNNQNLYMFKCGCLGCGRVFAGEPNERLKPAIENEKQALKSAIEHMESCCPNILADARRGCVSVKGIAHDPHFVQRCQIGCKKCEVKQVGER